MSVSKPFCFRCGQEPECQIELYVPDERAGKRMIAVWPLCVACVEEIDQKYETWGRFMARLVREGEL